MQNQKEKGPNTSRRHLHQFDAKAFLENHWQKKAVLLTQALPGFESPVTPDELAGLSLEDDIESRIIRQTADDAWDLSHGPFDEDIFEELDNKNWTLLVQAVDQWLEPVARLRELFDFIPCWRLDDIMISFAPTGGSVGPHYDNYDVFLLQAMGQRRWLLGQQCDSASSLRNGEPRLLADFETTGEHLLTPGDILYIPPGKAHHGISESDDCITISIGFRAPSHTEILQSYCDEMTDRLTEEDRYSDPSPLSDFHCAPGEIGQAVIDDLGSLLATLGNNRDALLQAFGQLMTEQRYPEETDVILQKNRQYQKRLGARIAWFSGENSLHVFANGSAFEVDKSLRSLVRTVADPDQTLLDTTDLPQEACPLYESLMVLGVYDYL